jgi:hypothetical protein
MQVKPNTRWWDGNGAYFHILAVTNIEGKDWVHYIKEGDVREDRLPGENEYSCFLESFVSRFIKAPV